MANSVLTWCVLCSLSAFVASQTTSSCPKQLANAPSQPIAPLKGTEPQVCLGEKTCCTNQIEQVLQTDNVIAFKSKIVKKYGGTTSSLLTLYDDLKNYFEDTIQNALLENTRKWTTDKSLPEAGRVALSAFFSDLQRYLTDKKVILREVVKNFFKETFPILYQHTMSQNRAPLKKSYSKCLKDKYDLILPFGHHPGKITAQLSQALEPVQVFLGSLKFGAKIIEDSKGFNFTSGCDRALLQMSGCSLCKGYPKLKPCHRFCTDVLKNCLSTDLQLQKPWEGFIDSLNSLANGMAHGSNQYSIPNVMLTIHQSMGEALLYSVVKQTEVLTKANKHCSSPQYVSGVQATQKRKKTIAASPSPSQKISLFPKMETAIQKLRYMRSVFEELVRYICAQVSPPLSDFEKCWNGKDKGRYTVSPGKPSDFQPSQIDAQKLKRMVDLLEEKIKAIKSVAPVIDVDGESSGSSASGSNKIPNSGNCGDDEDCASGESGDKSTLNPNAVGDDGQLYFPHSTPKSPVQDGGNGGVGAGVRGGDATRIRQSALLFMIPFFYILLL